MKRLLLGLAACLLLGIVVAPLRAGEPLVDLPPPISSDSCTDLTCGQSACRPAAIAAVERVRGGPRIVARVAQRIQRRPLLRRLFSRRSQVGARRR